MFKILDNGQVLSTEEINTGTQNAIIEKPYCMSKKLVIEGPVTCAINSPITATVKAFDWQNNPLPDENRPIKVTITGPGQPAELTLNPVNGQAEFDFESPIPGTFKIQAIADFPCDAGTLEAIVNE